MSAAEVLGLVLAGAFILLNLAGALLLVLWWRARRESWEEFRRRQDRAYNENDSQ